jgi:putative holliday junction resolvase
MTLVLGIDHGEARIGLAVSDELGMFAHPLETVPARDPKAALDRVVSIVAAKKIGMIVIGLPRNMDGTYGPAAIKVRAFAEDLKSRVASCEVSFVDERLSTVAAQKALHASGRNVKQSRSVVDQVAAQMILQTYLDREAYKAAN